MKNNCVEFAVAADQRAGGFDESCRNGPADVPEVLENSERPPSARKIEQSIAYMMQHLDKPLQVSTLAATVNVSPSHFFVLFKKWAGCPPIDYFIRLRMQRACQLLDAGSLPVKQVAAELGYDDPFYFSRVFKSVNQMAPSDYKAAQKRMVRKSQRNEAASVLPRECNAAGSSGRIQFA